MSRLNSDAQSIIEKFKVAITGQMEKVKKCATYYNDKALVAQVNEILKADDILSEFSCWNERKRIFNPKFGNEMTKHGYQNYVTKISVSQNIILDLIAIFCEFNELFNQSEKYKISINHAMYLIGCMERVNDVINQEKKPTYGISILNAAEAYQYITGTDVSPDEIKKLRLQSKAKWLHHLKLSPIGKGKHGASLYNLEKLADFIRNTERTKLTKLTTTTILQSFDKYKQEL